MIGQEKELSRFKDFKGVSLKENALIIVAHPSSYGKRDASMKTDQYNGLDMTSKVLRVRLRSAGYLTIGEFKARCVIWE